MNRNEKPRLSPREGQVLTLACRGLNDQQIAMALGIKNGTVRTYVSRLLIKTGAANRLQLGAVARGDPDAAPSG